MRLEGGFQGRPNKLVDGCYSFWVGAVFPLLQLHFTPKILCDSTALQEYVLLCAQAANGGLRDKPGKNRDYYHTCYCLSGLSSAQHGLSNNGEVPPRFLVSGSLCSCFCWLVCLKGALLFADLTRNHLCTTRQTCSSQRIRCITSSPGRYCRHLVVARGGGVLLMARLSTLGRPHQSVLSTF